METRERERGSESERQREKQREEARARERTHTAHKCRIRMWHRKAHTNVAHRSTYKCCTQKHKCRKFHTQKKTSPHAATSAHKSTIATNAAHKSYEPVRRKFCTQKHTCRKFHTHNKTSTIAANAAHEAQSIVDNNSTTGNTNSEKKRNITETREKAFYTRAENWRRHTLESARNTWVPPHPPSSNIHLKWDMTRSYVWREIHVKYQKKYT